MLLLAAHQADRRVQPHARVPRPRPGPGGELRRAPAPVRAAALGLERLRRVADLRGRRRLPAHAPSRSRCRRRSARRSGIEDERARARRADPARSCKAPVDLLCNGGIGTYVKASTESHADVGDKANDAVRVDGGAAALPGRRRGRQPRPHPARPDRVRAQRWPDSRAAGSTPTRSTTSPASTAPTTRSTSRSCSTALVADGDLTEKQRNELLAEMTDAVARPGPVRQLHADAGDQPRASPRRAPMVDVHARLIRHLEQNAGLEPRARVPARATTRSTSARRRTRAWSRPSWRSCMAYCKIHLYAAAARLRSARGPVPRPRPRALLPRAAAGALRRPDASAPPAPRDHRHGRRQPARRPRRHDVRVPAGRGDRRRDRRFWRAPTRSRARCSTMRSFWAAVEALDNQVAAPDPARDADRGPARWSSARPAGWCAPTRARSSIARDDRAVRARREDARRGAARRARGRRPGGVRRHGGTSSSEAGVPPELARRVAGMPSMLRAVRHRRGRRGDRSRARRRCCATYFRLGSRLELNWLRDRIIELPRANRWQALARAALRDDLFNLHRELTREVLEAGGGAGRQRGGDRRLVRAQRRGARAGARGCSPTSGRRGSTTTPRCRWRCARSGACSAEPPGRRADRRWARSRWPSSAARPGSPAQVGHTTGRSRRPRRRRRTRPVP